MRWRQMRADRLELSSRGRTDRHRNRPARQSQFDRRLGACHALGCYRQAPSRGSFKRFRGAILRPQTKGLDEPRGVELRLVNAPVTAEGITGLSCRPSQIARSAAADRPFQCPPR